MCHISCVAEVSQEEAPNLSTSRSEMQNYYRIQRANTASVVIASLTVLAFLVYNLIIVPKYFSALALSARLSIVALVSLALLDCYTLTVRVTQQHVNARFFLGWPERKVKRADIERVSVERPSALAGWGYRWMGPGNYMFRIYGLDAVRLKLRDGSSFFIGTDDAAGLKAALEG